MSRTTQRSRVAAVPVISTVIATVAALLVVLVGPAGPASAAAYRYWGYYQLSGSTWKFATQGPAKVTPADGAVEGWRFAVAGETDTRAPRVTTTFDAICGSTAVKPSTKRVAVVIDYGRAADQEDGTEPPAPVAHCASVPTAATGAEVLAAVATVRASNELICALDGLPATGCGGPVKSVSAAAAAPDTPVTLAPTATASSAAQAQATKDAGSTFWKYAGIGFVVLALLALGVVVLARRRSGPTQPTVDTHSSPSQHSRNPQA
jgi:hypothetical protein